MTTANTRYYRKRHYASKRRTRRTIGAIQHRKDSRRQRYNVDIMTLQEIRKFKGSGQIENWAHISMKSTTAAPHKTSWEA